MKIYDKNGQLYEADVEDGERFRDLERENARLREAIKLALHVRGTSEDTPEITRVLEDAIK